MLFTIEMKVTVAVTAETAVLLAGAARAWGENWGDVASRSSATSDALSSLSGALTEVVMPEQSCAHIPGLEIESTTVWVRAGAYED